MYAHQIPETNKQQQKGKKATAFAFQCSRQSMSSSIHVLNHQSCFESFYQGNHKIYFLRRCSSRYLYPMRADDSIFNRCTRRRFFFSSFLVVVVVVFTFGFCFVFSSLSFTLGSVRSYVNLSVCGFASLPDELNMIVDFVRLIIICSFQRRLHGDSFVVRIVLL